MLHARNRRRTPLLVVPLVLALSASAGAFTLIEFPTFNLPSGETFQHIFAGLRKTGFSLRSVDGSPLTVEATSTFDAEEGRQPGDRVQEGFVLLDGTLSLDVVAQKDGSRVHPQHVPPRSPARATARQHPARPAATRGALTRASCGLNHATTVH